VRIAGQLRSIGLAVILSWGWKRAVIALAAGALSALAMAPFNAWPVLLITFPVMVWLIDGAGAGRWRGVPAAAMAGWWFGLGYFVPGLYWIGYAFLVDASTFAWLLPFAILGLPAYLALFTAFGFALARLIWTRDASRVLALASTLTLSEWLRGHVLTGFPWNALGYALTEPLALAQTASLIGLWGLTFLSVAIFASPAVLIDGTSRGRKPWIVPMLALVLLVAMAIFGSVRLTLHPTSHVAKVKLRIMQPNLQQDVRFNYAAKAEVMQKYLTLSDRASGPQSTGVRDASILIWPESAFPFFLTREADAMAQISDLLPKGTVLITGAVRAPDLPPGTRITRAYNSIYVIDHDGSVLSVYDKLHLVPFGEYLPFQNLMEKLGFVQLTKVQGGFIPGERRRTMEIPNAPRVLPLICYEAIFPGDVATRDDRPGWIVNLTNDGWFGISTGPYQHLQQTRLRAIEEGLPAVRAANTGISAVIDPLGRIVARLGLGLEGVLDSSLPSAIPPTIYARAGDIPAAAIVIVALIFVIRRRMARRTSSYSSFGSRHRQKYRRAEIHQLTERLSNSHSGPLVENRPSHSLLLRGSGNVDQSAQPC
jgi:apolipoprotein N-acyltransferase